MKGYINDVNLLVQFSVSHHVRRIYDEASYLASCLLVETSSTEELQSISKLIERITKNRQKAGEIENENRSLVKLQNILNDLKLLNLQIGKYAILWLTRKLLFVWVFCLFGYLFVWLFVCLAYHVFFYPFRASFMISCSMRKPKIFCCFQEVENGNVGLTHFIH